MQENTVQRVDEMRGDRTGSDEERRCRVVTEVWVGGGRTYRGEVDTAEISGGFQASQYKLGMHTTLNTQSPFLYIFPRGVNSPHPVTIGLLTSMSQEHGRRFTDRPCRPVDV